MSSAAVVLGALRENMSVKQVGNPTHSQRTFLEKKIVSEKNKCSFRFNFLASEKKFVKLFSIRKKVP